MVKAKGLVLTSLQESLEPTSRKPTDVTFIFREEWCGFSNFKEIKAHKFVLSLVSDVFEAAFYGDIQDNGRIEIKDATAEAFEAMIHFIYNIESSVCNYDFEMICSLYCLADKYNIGALKEESLQAIYNKEISV